MHIKIINRANNETVWEVDNDKPFPVPRLDEHMIMKGIIYQVGDVVHDGDNNMLIVKVWREGTVR